MLSFRILAKSFFTTVVVFLLVPNLECEAEGLDPRLENFDIAPLVRFNTAEEAEAHREKLVQFIWPKGLPDNRPKVVKMENDCPELSAVDGNLVRYIEQFDVDVAGLDFHSLVYVAYPNRTLNDDVAKFAIVLPGHMKERVESYLSSGLSDAVDTLLREGFVVAVVQMPMVCWNHDSDGNLPNGSSFRISTRGVHGHNELFQQVESELKGCTLKFFLEPIVQTINELFARHPTQKSLLMLGFSGGGWATHLAAAIDPRVDVSIPVAGSLPLYARPFSRGSKGDAEQYYAPLYGENDTNDDGVLDQAAGVCTWLEIYALGSCSPNGNHPRHQIQVLNFYDSCCFSGNVYKTYNKPLTKHVESIGRGSWKFYSDDSHKKHLLSPAVIEKVLLPAITGMQIVSE